MESLHPVTVHFPIALILTAWGLESAGLILGRQTLHRISLWNLGLGVLGAGVAVLAGRQAAAIAKHSMEIHQVMSLHEQLGYWVLGLASLIFLGRVLLRDRLSMGLRRVAWLALTLVCGLMTFSAHLGGRMVYEYGVGGSYGRGR